MFSPIHSCKGVFRYVLLFIISVIPSVFSRAYENDIGLIGGENIDTGAPFVSFVTPNGGLVPIELPFISGAISSVSINQ